MRAKCNNHPGKLYVASILPSLYIIDEFFYSNIPYMKINSKQLSTLRLKINFPVEKSGAVMKLQSHIVTWFP